MTENYIYSMHKVGKTYPPDRKVLRDISLSFFYGAKIGVLGLNGAGKSTLLKIMAGVEQEFIGEAKPAEGVSIGYLPQEPALDETKTVKENAMAGLAHITTLLSRFEEISSQLGDPDLEADKMEKLLTEQAECQEKIEHLNGWELDHTVEVAMDALRLPPPEASVTNLSGGEKRRIALCRLILSRPDMMLLDEPTNHLDAESVAWLEQFLKEYQGTVVAVTHDRYFLDNIAGWILELDRGHGIPWQGNYSSWLEQKKNRLALEEKQESARQKTLERELEWIRMSPRARQAKSKSRITAYEQLLAQDRPERVNEMEIYIPPGPRLGDVVIKGDRLTMSYGDKLLFKEFSFDIRPGSIIGIIGANGVGKTTLFKLIAKQSEPDSGEIVIGDTVKLAYVDQTRDALNAQNSVWEEISGGQDTLKLGGKDFNSRAYCARFNFSGSDQQKKVGALSGGERNRVHMAKLLKSGGNVLLLDEPSNDLDVNTLRALEEAIGQFSGTVLVISHDRWFLNRVATHIMAFEGDSQVVLVEGDFDTYEEDKKKRLGADSVHPKRVKFKNNLLD